MINFLVIGLLFLLSIGLGFIKYGSLADQYNGKSWQLKFIEFWNDFANFFIAALVAYYFVHIRLPLLIKGASLNVADFFLFIIFTLGIFGHLCVMSKNITDGVEAILKRVLERN